MAESGPDREDGGWNVYVLVKNRPTNNLDYLGLRGRSAKTECCPKPGGKRYDPSEACCIDEEIIKRQPVPTGISFFYQKPLGESGKGPFTNHRAFGRSGNVSSAVGIESYPDSEGSSDGKSNDEVIWTPDETTSHEQRILLSPCDYDIEIFRCCMEAAMSDLIGTIEPFCSTNPLAFDTCHTKTQREVDRCKAQAKR